MRLGQLTPIVLLAALLASTAGCGESPSEVFTAASKASESKDFAAFSALLTERTATLFRRLQETQKKSRGRYEYLRDLTKVLPSGEVLSEDIRDNLAVLSVGKSERTAEEVILLRETDGWRIDLFESPRLWAPLVKKSTKEARK